LGKYNFKELPNILKDVDIGVVPFPPNEFNNHTIHNKVFDFMAFGIPLLVSDAVPLKRLVEEANCGISLRIDETTIKRFFNGIDDYDWETMSQNAWEISRTKYNWAVDESKLLRFLRRFIQ
jgi:glycosyltransferase involved in cell wall biosynthesis